MEIVCQQVEVWDVTANAMKLIERAGRKCYMSDHLATATSSNDFVRMLIRKGHLSVLEHAKATLCFTTNRGVTHELVRHRIASYSQTSTRYVNYRRSVPFIEPVWWLSATEEAKTIFLESCKHDETTYNRLLDCGWRPEEAREVLPNALKTEIVVTYNMSMWRHVLKVRTSKVVHPQTRSLMLIALDKLKGILPVIFEDL